MRFPVDAARRTQTGAKLALILALALPLGGCLFSSGGGDGGLATAGTPLALVGPEADYPVVLGDAYSVAGTQYKPEDVMNYDEVGYLAADGAGGTGISAAHHTLPLPSYVEVTSLDTGRTILVRVERRGPMDGTQLLALSPGAMDQLDARAGTPVRVRRVNSPEDQRAMLRTGQAAPLRMDTPMSLVAVLKRKLPGSIAASAPVAAPSPPVVPAVVAAAVVAGPAQVAPAPVSVPVSVPVKAEPERELPALAVRAPVAQPTAVPAAVRSAASIPAPAPRATPSSAPAAAPAAVPATPAQAAQVAPGKGFVVQAAAFSSEDNAQKAARTLGGTVTRSGAFWRVRTGPFPSRSAAEASLAKVKAAGYSDARIFANS